MQRDLPTIYQLRQPPLLHFPRQGFWDVIDGLMKWRVWHLMGSMELRRRYVRSRLGQFWLTLSTGILIASLGIVWSLLWKMPAADLLPYFAISMILWTMLTGIIGDATTVFVANGHYFINQKMSLATAINALLYRNLLCLLHNAVIIVLVFALFPWSISFFALLAIPGLCMAVCTAFWVSYIVAMLCTRYRDLVQVTTTILQIAFFVTPILFKAEFIPKAYQQLAMWNPFAIYLSIIRDPILGVPVSWTHWLVAITITVGGFFLALPIIGRYHWRVVYWL